MWTFLAKKWAKLRPYIWIHIPRSRWEYVKWEPDMFPRTIHGAHIPFLYIGGYSWCCLPHAMDDPDQPKFLLAPLPILHNTPTAIASAGRVLMPGRTENADTRKPPT